VSDLVGWGLYLWLARGPLGQSVSRWTDGSICLAVCDDAI